MPGAEPPLILAMLLAATPDYDAHIAAQRKRYGALVLEAMKMEQTTRSPAAPQPRSPADGVVKQVKVREGDQVTAGQILIVMED